MFEEVPKVNEFYDGSTMFQSLTYVVGMPIDQINFIICQISGMIIGILFRYFCPPERYGALTRHLVEVLIGVWLAYFCFGKKARLQSHERLSVGFYDSRQHFPNREGFGFRLYKVYDSGFESRPSTNSDRQIILLVIQTVISLALMKSLRPGVMEKSVLGFSVGFLAVCHLYRMYYDYGGYTLDITGPLMLNTQRLSSLAYNLRDGLDKNQEKLSDNMKRLAIRSPPSLLELTSYVFYFHGLMVGPFCFFKDYIAFIEGVNLHKPATSNGVKNSNQNDHTNNQISTNHTTSNQSLPTMPESVFFSKLLSTVVFGISTVVILPWFSPKLLTVPEFDSYSFLYKNLVVIFTMSLLRQKYYFAWKLGESVNAAAGLCFNGYDENGKPRWDLTENADIYIIETGDSIKVVLDAWNKSTTAWLRYVVYERTRSSMLVFLFSAVWHGFYPGYYITFLFGGVYLDVARRLRRLLRPKFQGTPQMSRLYNFITLIVTKTVMPYAGFPFVLLESGLQSWSTE